MPNKNVIDVCICGSLEHQVVYSFDDDEGWNEYMFIHVHLVPSVWYKRIWPGIRHIFGYKCKYGNYDEVIFNREQVEHIRDRFNFALSKMPEQQ